MQKKSAGKFWNRSESWHTTARSDMSTSTSDPSQASKETPFVNSLGLPFVPIPRFDTLFCVWPLRLGDYKMHAAEAGVELPTQAPGAGDDHPVVSVTWDEALAFCDWLTEREKATLPEGLVYRLPGDLEWSAAVGLPPETGTRPESRSGETDGYPWEGGWPPPKNAGNYSQELAVDSFEFTSPVGSFPANALGLFDLGGNVWEWCMDFNDRSGETRVLRGASWFNGYADRIKSSFRNDLGYPTTRYTSYGFRVVLGAPMKR
jgi:formylglycine-generating enzyme required for sulfatase activity